MMTEKPHLFERLIDFASSPTGMAAFAGIAGGVLRWVSEKEKPIDGLATVIAGALTAIYIGPPATYVVARWLQMPVDEPQLVAGVSFVVGVGGISIGSLLVSAFRSRAFASVVREILVALVSRKPPGGGPT